MIRKENIICHGRVTLDHATITEDQRIRLKGATEGNSLSSKSFLPGTNDENVQQTPPVSSNQK
ncbi:hypothetical protein ACFCYN_14230 [Gottfriedia sp. NPDC056225]|uniref:hypothetical protein n=1 Tax=Gottfriedia sp. NPDC056225 TaxID=3345751 RepID=UPI0035DBD8B7